jgi:isoleucyl-tRNA synthetase
MNYPDLPESLLRLEEEILALWSEEDLFQQTMDATRGGDPFVFYEGPPTANGRPGLHHIISRTIKDLVCRHRTMCGHRVTRIAGWDTHGLPVEIEAEQKLGISGKPEIEAFGIARFNEVCRESVFTYKEEWERFSERIGYWLDYSSPYVTFHTDYIESVWWILKELAGRGLLYRGYKSVPYCPRCGTALSSHEVAQGYEDVVDPSLYFLCDWVGETGDPDSEKRSFLVWTTTPWTVPSNTGLAVRGDLEYVEVEWRDRRVILAADRVEEVFGEETETLRTYSGHDLVGVRYRRPLGIVAVTAEQAARGWRVVAEDFVTADDGSGVVHLAPAFGADDYEAGLRHDFPLLRPVDDRGHFFPETALVGGMFVKDADSVLLKALEEEGALFRTESVTHSYPHCWRCSSPLIYMARDSWFAATSSLREELLENNRSVSWHPPETGERRFGDWLANNVDWALSRDRFWGTPLPVWVCDEDDTHIEWIGSISELAQRAGELSENFDPHRPYIDELSWSCETCEGSMRRHPSVLDVWFDSGAMPYAQWHWPYENEESFRGHFPADFICEALDQTRGWFYSLLAIGTMLGKGSPFRNVIVNDMILDAEGRKMSKSKGNMVDPWDAISEFGSDPLRWYLITASNPWTTKRYDPGGVREAARKFFDTMMNTYRFFALYGNVEGWTAGAEDPQPAQRPALDRWLLSRLHRTVSTVEDELARYELTPAYRAVLEFVNEDLSNWFVRRSRPRFWGNTDSEDSRAAFRTLWDALVTVSRLTAPVTPLFSDWLHRAATDGSSVHLSSFPEADPDLLDESLELEMAGVRALVSLGRAAREEVRIRVRQPLGTLHCVLPDLGTLRPELVGVLREELNVKEVLFSESTDRLIRQAARPNFRKLGPRFQANSEAAAQAIRDLDAEALARFSMGEAISISVDGESVILETDWIDLAEEAVGDLAVKSHDGHVVALDPTLDDELRAEGMARELINRIQRLRKDTGLEITDRIRLGIEGTDEVHQAVSRFEGFIARETLALEVSRADDLTGDGYQAVLEDEIDGFRVRVALSRAG